MTSKVFAVLSAPSKSVLSRNLTVLGEADRLDDARTQFAKHATDRDDYVCLMSFQLFGGGVLDERLEK